MIKYFFGQVNLFKKQVLQHVPPSKIDLIESPLLSKEEIANFDQYYTNIVKQQIVRENGKKKLIQQVYTPNIYGILESKIGGDQFQIIQFLALRRDQLREEEVVFCLDGLVNGKQVSMLKHTDILPHIDQLISIKKLVFTKPECIKSIVVINKQLQFLSMDSQRLLAKQLNDAGQYIEKSILEEEEKMEILAQAFIVAAEINYNNVITQAHLIHVRKIIKRHFKLLTFSTLFKYFTTIIKHQQKLQTELDSILDIEEFFGENYNVLTLDNYITIIEHLAIIKHKKRSEVVIQFAIHLNEFELTIQQVAVLAKSFAILEVNIEQIWTKIQTDYLKLLNLIDASFYLGEITLIFQSLLKMNPMKITDLTTIYEKIKHITIDQSYTLKFQLLYNISILGHFNFELFHEICEFERNTFEFKYLNTYKQDKLFELVKIFLFNTLHYSKVKNINEKSDITIQRVITTLCNRIFEVINNKNYELTHTFTTYFELYQISSLFQTLIDNTDGLQENLINVKLENVRQDSLKKMDRMIQRNQFKVINALKLLGFIDYFKVPYKEQAYKELIQMIGAKLIEFENDLDSLSEMIFLYKIENKQVVQQFGNLVLEKQAELTMDDEEEWSPQLRLRAPNHLEISNKQSILKCELVLEDKL